MGVLQNYYAAMAELSSKLVSGITSRPLKITVWPIAPVLFSTVVGDAVMVRV